MRNDYDPFRIPAYDPGTAFKVSSPYGYREDPVETSRLTREPNQKKKPEFHSGQDYTAPAGTPISSAAPGAVVYSGYNKNLGNVVIVRNDRGDYSLYGHMQDGARAQLGQRLEEGDTIGSVGQTGDRVKGVHLHYSVIRPEVGAIIEKGPGNGGSIGIHLDGFTTNEPAGLPEYLDHYKRASEILFGLDEKAPMNDTPPPNRPGQPFFNPFNQTTPAPEAAAPPSAPNRSNSFADRYPKWGSVPLPNEPAASDAPASFADRFGNWASVLSGAPGNAGANVGAPPLRAPGQRSEIPDGVTPAPVTAEDDNTSVRRLANLSSPASTGAPPPVPSTPPPMLGIFSGRPMRDDPVLPDIFQTKDQTSPGDDELYQRWLRMLDA